MKLLECLKDNKNCIQILFNNLTDGEVNYNNEFTVNEFNKIKHGKYVRQPISNNNYILNNFKQDYLRDINLKEYYPILSVYNNAEKEAKIFLLYYKRYNLCVLLVNENGNYRVDQFFAGYYYKHSNEGGYFVPVKANELVQLSLETYNDETDESIQLPLDIFADEEILEDNETEEFDKVTNNDLAEFNKIDLRNLGFGIYDWGFFYEESVKNQSNSDQVFELINTKLKKIVISKSKYNKSSLETSKKDYIIKTRQGIQIRKTRVLGSHLHKQRLYYCYGEQLNDERLNKNDIVLLYCSTPSQHDDYNKIAQNLADEIELGLENIEKYSRFYNEYIFDEKTEKFEKRPLLTERQSGILDSCLGNPPSIIYGAAGTGKTLMSEKLYEKLFYSEGIGNNILYLTFIDSLANHVKNELESYGISSVESITYSAFTKMCFEKAYAYYKQDIYKYNVIVNGKEECREKDSSYFYKWITKDKSVTYPNAKKNTIDDLRNKGIKLEDIDKNPYDAASIIYLFFRSLNTERNYRSFEDIRYSKFDDKLKDEKDLNSSKKKTIFKFCQAYEQHLKTYGFMDDNIASFILSDLFKKHDCPIEKYDSIIIDEMQDLTMPQIESLLNIVKYQHIYAYGDDNQSINPSLLKMREARNKIYEICKINRSNEAEPEYLTEIMRSSKEVVDYINLLNDIRAKAIGADKRYCQEKLVSKVQVNKNKKSDKPAYMVNKQGFSNLMNNKELFLSNEIGIITINESEKEDFSKKFIDINKNNLFTIEDIKGREREIIILYNFFSSSIPIWEKIAEKYIHYDGKDKLYSTLYRRFFNRYYVGLTRAKKKVIIYENGNLPDSIKKTFLNNSECRLEYIENQEKLNDYFANDFTHDKWFSKAEEYFKTKQYNDAYYYITNAIERLEKIEDKDIYNEYYDKYKELENVYYTYYLFDTIEKDNNTEQDKNDKIKHCLNYFIELNDDEKVEKLYSLSSIEKYELLKAIKEAKNNKKIISSFNKIKNSLNELELDYFGVKVLNSYKEIIKDKIGGLTSHGRENN